MNRNGLSITDILAPLFVLAIVAFFIFAGVSGFQQNTHTDCVVTSTEVANSDTKFERNLVHTENCGTVSVDDADTFSSIQDGEVYTFNTTGVRFLTWYPSVTAVQ